MQIKRILAWFLCLSIVVGCLPVSPLDFRASAEDGIISVPFIGLSGVENNAMISTVTYIHTGNVWKFMGESAGVSPGTRLNRHYYSSSGGVSVEGLGKDQWVAYEIKDIEAGSYDITLDYLQSAAGCGADMYIAPAKSNWSISDVTSADYIGSVDFDSPGSDVYVKDGKIGKFTAQNDGEYVIVFKGNGIAADSASQKYYAIWLHKLTMTSVTPNFTATLGSEGLAIGGSTELGVSLTVGKDTVVDIDYGDITVTFGDESIASFDAQSGKVTALKAGNTTVTVSTVYEGETLTQQLTLSVMALSGEYLEYNFANHDKYPLNQSSPDLISANHGAGYVRRLNNENEYMWVDIEVEKTGAFIAEIETLNYAGGPIVNVHLIPEGVSDFAQTVLSGKYKLGEIDMYASKDIADFRTAFKSIAVTQPGKYHLVLQGTGRKNPGAVNTYVHFNKFFLDGTELESVEMSAPDKVYVGNEYQIELNAVTERGTSVKNVADIVYSSSAPSIAEVDENGLLNAKAIGETQITASVTWGGIIKTDSIEVKAEYSPSVLMESAEIDIADKILTANNKTSVIVSAVAKDSSIMDLSDAQIVFSSSNEDVASIDKDTGEITAKSVGFSEIGVKISLNGIEKDAKQNVYVIEDANTLWVKSVTPIMDKNAVDIGDSGNAGFNAEIGVGSAAAILTMDEIKKLQGFEISFASDNDGVLSIDNEGKYTAHAKGVATITVSLEYNGASKKGTVILPVAQLAGVDYEYNFLNGNYSAVWETDYSHTGDTWQWHGNNAGWTPTAKTANIFSYGIQAHLRPVGNWIALKVKVPKAGMYYAELTHGRWSSGATTDVYMLRGDIEDIDVSLVPDNKIGSVRFYWIDKVEEKSTLTKLEDKPFLVEKDGGELIMVIKATDVHNGGAMYLEKLTLRSVNILVDAELNFDADTIECSGDADKNSTYAHVLATLRDGTLVTEKDIKCSFRSSDPEVASVAGDGKVIAKNAGYAEITATVVHNGSMLKATKTIRVEDNSEPLSAALTAPKSVFVRGDGNVDFNVAMSSGGTMKALANGATAEFNVSMQPEGAASFDPQTGKITGITAGTITIGAVLTFRGKVFADIEPITVEIENSAKGKSTIYTDEVRDALRYNAVHDATVKADAEKTIKSADRYINQIDLLYDKIVGEGLFRYYFVGRADDPNKYYCRYCGLHIPDVASVYGWVTDPINAPWKIQCPGCRRKFPTNDFGKYYELGLDEKGIFDPERAKAAHIELFGGLEDVGYLKNDLYPEMDEHINDAGELVNPGVHGWGVDDGFGYVTKNPKTGYEEHHYYIAFYLHQAIWDGSNGLKQGAIPTILADFMNAYLYTGQVKYGRAGAILLDRIADFYPDFDWYQWHEYRGDEYQGKIVDPVWSCAHANTFIRAYDAFYPIYEDENVINYLSEKAILHGTNEENPKDSPDALRMHIEKNILHEAYKAAVENKISGNFGMDQNVVASAAVVLNTMPETGEWLDWVMAPGVSYNSGANPPKRIGGNVLPQMLEVVDRDGMGNEGSPSYNSGWIELLISMADVLSGYELYPTVDLYKNPKFIKMFSAQLPLIMSEYYTAQIGDTGAFASTNKTISQRILATAYKQTGDIQYAQGLYLINGNSAEGLSYDETVKDPSKLEDEVKAVIAKHGELDLGSTLMSGYGLSVLRDGDKYPNSNTHRNFWMYYGKNRGHAHRDSLNLSMDAFGLNLTPELGYPNATGADPNRHQWVAATISHNTVTVNERTQANTNSYGFPIHFDDSGKVKVMDAERSVAYSNTDVYRRTVVMVEVDDTVSYGVDFFRVEGGDDHLYSFHAQSAAYGDTEGLNLIPADDPENTYAGFKSGEFVEYGEDPHSNSGVVESGDGLTYPAGYTWMKNVESDSSPEKKFAVDFNIKDFRNVLKDNKDIHLRMTMVNDFALDEVSVVDGFPVDNGSNPNTNIKYVLARRKGQGLKTLFTTVLEPYKGDRYLSGMESVAVVRADGKGILETEVAKAVKVIHKDGRVDYVIYAQDNTVNYNVIDGELTIPFKGFVGVVTYKATDEKGTVYKDAVPAYTYLHDGDIIADNEPVLAAYTGSIVSYTEELTMQNYIEIDVDQAEVNIEELPGKIINVDNDRVLNGVYNIVGAEKLENGNIRLDIGDVTVVRGYIDGTDIEKGYVFNIEPGQNFRIPLSSVIDSAPYFVTENKIYTATEGKSMRFTVNAHSELGRPLTYEAVTLPRGAIFDAETKTFTWTPGNTQIGEYSTAIRVSDGVLSDTYNALITVYKSAGPVGSSSSGNQSGTESGTQSGTSTPPAGGGASGGGGGGSSSSADTSDTTKLEETTKTEDTTDTEDNAGGGSATVEKFIDLGAHAWARDAIYALVEKGVINGMSENTYSPARKISRADFAIMLVRAFDITAGDGEHFADVDANKYYAEELRLAKANGIVGGIGDNKFNPEGEITRQDMVVMLVRALKAAGKEVAEVDESVFTQFADAAAISDYAREAVAQLVKMGAIAGAEGRINPTGSATRAEVAVMLSRIFK